MANAFVESVNPIEPVTKIGRLAVPCDLEKLPDIPTIKDPRTQPPDITTLIMTQVLNGLPSDSALTGDGTWIEVDDGEDPPQANHIGPGPSTTHSDFLKPVNWYSVLDPQPYYPSPSGFLLTPTFERVLIDANGHLVEIIEIVAEFP